MDPRTTREKIEAALERGEPACRVAKSLGVSRQYVHQIKRQLGQPRRPVGRPRKPGVLEAIVKMLRAEGETYAADRIESGDWKEYR